MKKLWNGFKIAFSMYSKIPMPGSDWTDENMRYALLAFPLVGVPIGLLTLLWRALAGRLGLSGSAFSAVVLLLIPAAITGGIHLDGLLDTADALSSYKGKEERLEILKDSRAGAFAVIQAAAYFFLYYGVYSYMDLQFGEGAGKVWQVIALSFLLSRALSGYAVVAFPKAKQTGLAVLFAKKAEGRLVQAAMAVYGILIFILMACVSPALAIAVYLAAFLVFVYYYVTAVRKFGGITGDLAGWFLQKCELAMALTVMIVYVLGGVV